MSALGYMIVDMAIWGMGVWSPSSLGDDAWAEIPEPRRFHDDRRPDPPPRGPVALKDGCPPMTVMDDEARGFMFKHLAMRRGLRESQAIVSG